MALSESGFQPEGDPAVHDRTAGTDSPEAPQQNDVQPEVGEPIKPDPAIKGLDVYAHIINTSQRIPMGTAETATDEQLEARHPVRAFFSSKLGQAATGLTTIAVFGGGLNWAYAARGPSGNVAVAPAPPQQPPAGAVPQQPTPEAPVQGIDLNTLTEADADALTISQISDAVRAKGISMLSARPDEIFSNKGLGTPGQMFTVWHDAFLNPSDTAMLNELAGQASRGQWCPSVHYYAHHMDPDWSNRVCSNIRRVVRPNDMASTSNDARDQFRGNDAADLNDPQHPFWKLKNGAAIASTGATLDIPGNNNASVTVAVWLYIFPVGPDPDRPGQQKYSIVRIGQNEYDSLKLQQQPS